jgi:hypothetical protein
LSNICVTLKKRSSEYQPYACGIFFASLDLEQKSSFMDEHLGSQKGENFNRWNTLNIFRIKI